MNKLYYLSEQNSFYNFFYTKVVKFISQINETLKNLCSRNNFIFVEHKNIAFDDLWVDGIHLLNSGKAILGSNFSGNFMTYLL